jgi:hypothetical protein
MGGVIDVFVAGCFLRSPMCSVYSRQLYEDEADEEDG